jgi:hypothetical protein
MKRASLCFGLALAACATAAPPPERVAGCWIDRDAGVTMRWFADDAAPSALVGDWLRYQDDGVPVSMSFRLEPSDTGWRLCSTTGDATCWRVAQGEGGSLEGGRAFIDGDGARLRIAILGDGDERVIFDGRRDGCD